MIKYFRLILIIAIALAPAYSMAAAFSADSVIMSNDHRLKTVKNPVGKEFWLCFQSNFKETGKFAAENDLNLELFLTSDELTNVTIEIPGLQYKLDTIVPPGNVINIKLSPDAQCIKSEETEQKAVHIVAESPISVYGLNRRFQTTDSYLGLPVEVLGYDYRIMSYSFAKGFMGQFAVVATEDSTTITILSEVDTQKIPKGIPSRFTLNRGDVLQVQEKYSRFESCDLTGCRIKSNKKIAVFSGHQCAYVPKNVIACNHLVEQIPPISSWGTHFFLGTFRSRFNYTYRVLAHQDSTNIFEGTKLVETLNSGEYYEKTTNKNEQITASRPVLVAQYSHGFNDGDNIGDPMMIIISPTQQFLSHYTFATPIQGSWNHYVNLIVPTAAIGTLKLNEAPINPGSFQPLGLSRYSIGYIKVPYGTHSIRGAKPFGMYSYGFGYKDSTKQVDHSFDAYGTMGGQSFFEYEAVDDIIAPVAELQNETRPESYIVIRDDRPEDTGIMYIHVQEIQGLKISSEKVTAGTPHFKLDVKSINPKGGRAIITSSDMAGNTSDFTLCYSSNPYTGKMEYSLSSGINEDCNKRRTIDIGLFTAMSADNHSLNFVNSGNITAKGNWTDATDMSYGFGLQVGKTIMTGLNISVRLSLHSYDMNLSAADSFMVEKFYDNGQTKYFQQEATEMNLSLLMFRMSASTEYFMNKMFYLTAGLHTEMAMSDEISMQRRLISPSGYCYANGKQTEEISGSPTELGSLSSLRFAMSAGAGVRVGPIRNFSPFAEMRFMYNFNSVVDDQDWDLNQLLINVGVIYNLDY